MEIESVESKVTRILADVMHLKLSQVVPSSKLVADLDADSFDLVLLQYRIEDEFGIEVTYDALIRGATVEDVMTYVKDKLAQKAQTSTMATTSFVRNAL